MMRTKISIILFLLSFSLVGFSQAQPIRISGQIVDSLSGSPLELATVLLRDPGNTRTWAGTTTDAEGRFELPVDSVQFALEVRFIGFRNKQINGLVNHGTDIDLGAIQLGSDVKDLDAVDARGERSITEFRLDKRVFHVGQDLGNSGSSALEVLNNVPSVTVSMEGAISLRGSGGVQILIDGKPSVLADEQGKALGTITADMIDRIEVITNPGANYQSEGTSGIINIILKKEEKKGLNGSISINTGWPQNHSLGFTMNRRSEHFNIFTQIGAGYRSLPRYQEAINEDRTDSTVIESSGTNYRNEQFYNFVLGSDFYLNKFNTITLSGNVAYEIEQQPSETNFSRTEQGVLVSEWLRTESTSALNPKYQYDLQYKKVFKDTAEHSLLFTTLGKFFGKEQSSEFSTRVLSGGLEYPLQQTQTSFEQADYTFSLDYVKPFNKRWKFETGAQYVINNVGNNYEVRDLENDVWITADSLSNNFEYKQRVLGVYATGAYELEKWGLKLGLRVENTELHTRLVTTQQENDQLYTNLFPTLHTSFKVSRYVSLQAGYSRRIYRPRLWDLNPFFNITNNFNIRRGNPDLQPEYTDSYEVMSIFILKKASFNIGGYYRYTTEVIERVSIFENNVNTTLPMNIGTNSTVGLEFNAKYSPAKWFTVTADANYNYFQRKGSFQNQLFDFFADKWNGRMTTRFKLSKIIDFELTGNYESRARSIQGINLQSAYLDAGFRVKLMKGKGVIDVGARDLFATRIERNIIDQDNFYLYSYGKRGRFLTIGFSYGFGKGEAMTYSGGGHYR